MWMRKVIVMLYRRNKLLPALFACFAVAASAAAQTFDHQARLEMDSELTRVLLEKDVGEVANELARERPTTILPLLRQLNIFTRAGHRARVLQTLNQLAEASDMPPISHRWFIAQTIKEMIGRDDLAALRMYYERLMPFDTDGADALVRLWEIEGDAKELDAWLAASVEQHSGWFQFYIARRVQSGTINELLDALATDVKAHPEDMEHAFHYLKVNDLAGRPQNVAWLAGIFEAWLQGTSAPRSAYEFYELGGRLPAELSQIAAKAYERSLALPFTERDMQLIREQVIIRFAVSPRVKNWDKQLRFWTKRQLAETYQALKQPQAAQKLIEELVTMKGDSDIMLEDVHQLAGAVQAQSGMRVVETKILRDEATERESAAYWMERAEYYKGRKEHDMAMDTYRRAFAHLPLKPDDKASASARFLLLSSFTTFVRYAEGDEKRDERRAELKQVLRREFTMTAPETEYAYRVAKMIADNEFDFDDLRDSLLVKNKNVLGRLLGARKEWTNDEEWLIEETVCREAVSPERKADFWPQLEALAKSGAASRSYYLAVALVDCKEARRAIPLLISYLRHIRASRAERAKFMEEEAVNKLFAAYLGAGNWQAAEKLLFNREGLTGKQLVEELSRVALAAAREEALDDALRLWSMTSNLDRRYLDELVPLSKTVAREPLREMYAQMKKKDPLSFVPDRALRILQ
jgi:tetratricopeptide (TPR) repeat protein